MIYTFIAAVIIFALFLGLPTYHIMMVETNIDKLEKHLLKNQKNLDHALIYAVANKQDDEVSRIIDRLLVKNYNPQKQVLYKAIYAGYQKNLASAKNEIASIHSPKFRHYYEAALHIEEGNLELARTTAAKIPSQYMQQVLFAEIEVKSGNRQEAIALAKQALQSCKGLYRYQIYKNYERELPEAIAEFESK
ncbi:hypothetical protein I6N90_13700 [Paenibacillus sp. GSMTC-2017]|uniref:hypothetical protein n=1 Tax=Paenibacillus sp. GSMTC-2017 TaxID=2794350 RepID=UPI0018D61DEB|nr:hypothetical protein [Paenibacillus sp. GSMTC-2017]MBH5318854.1 hypothetical protein [Paenibacillus sp. GSMTC-2017]